MVNNAVNKGIGDISFFLVVFSCIFLLRSKPKSRAYRFDNPAIDNRHPSATNLLQPKRNNSNDRGQATINFKNSIVACPLLLLRALRARKDYRYLALIPET
jgi:hypothetical protein